MITATMAMLIQHGERSKTANSELSDIFSFMGPVIRKSKSGTVKHDTGWHST
ncbi:MAG: hypothetical protein WAW68_03480 [Rhodoferax sp.]